VYCPEPVTFSFPSGRMNVAGFTVGAYDNTGVRIEGPAAPRGTLRWFGSRRLHSFSVRQEFVENEARPKRPGFVGTAIFLYRKRTPRSR
jgi:hypothetical protein